MQAFPAGHDALNTSNRTFVRTAACSSTVVASLLVVCMLGSAAQAASPGQPYVPGSNAQILEHLPSTSDPRVRQFEVLKRSVAAKPGDVNSAIALANAYLDYGRDTGDARYLGRAQAVITPWARKHPASNDALVVQATILQSRHQFVESRQILQAVLQRDKDNLQGWLTLASVALVQGDMDEGRRDCAHLIRGADALVVVGCIGSWSAVTGNAQNALHAIEVVMKTEQNASPALQSWAHGLMADAAKYLGQTERADAEYKQALQLAPGDNFLIATYGDFLLDHGRAREVLELTRGYSQSDTSFLRQVLAETVLKLPVTNADIQLMASRFRDLEQRGDSALYGREEARFELDLQHDPVRALKLAQANWSIQHAPEDIRVYLEAALAAGQPGSAQAVLDLLAKTHLEDPKVRALAAQVAALFPSHAAAAEATH
jgi:Tfp pilus assembly protein PilF